MLIEYLSDSQILELSKNILILDNDFGNILEKMSSFASLLPVWETRKEMLHKIIEKRKVMKSENWSKIITRDITEEKVRNATC